MNKLILIIIFIVCLCAVGYIENQTLEAERQYSYYAKIRKANATKNYHLWDIINGTGANTTQSGTIVRNPLFYSN